MNTYQILTSAMEKRKPVRATYNGKPRVLCPHVLGTTGGDMRGLFLQIGGESTSAMAPDGARNWRCMRLSRLTDVAISEDSEWRTAAGWEGYESLIENVATDIADLPEPSQAKDAVKLVAAVEVAEEAPEPPCATYVDYLDLILRLCDKRLAKHEGDERRGERLGYGSYGTYRPRGWFEEQRRRDDRLRSLIAAVDSERASGRWDDSPLGRLAAKHGFDAAEQILLVHLALHGKEHAMGFFDFGPPKRGLPSLNGKRLLVVAADDRAGKLAARRYLYADGRLRISALIKTEEGVEGSPETMKFKAVPGLARELLGHGLSAKTDTESDEDEGLVRRVAPRFKLADVVLGTAEREKIDLSLAPLRTGATTPREWGLDSKIKYGRGVGFVFAGPPGTGKTLCAEAIAGELGRPLLVVQVPQLMGMFVGETQKHIAEVFQRAKDEDGGAVLFFDEADSLFFDRSTASRSWEVQDVNVLLTEIERHEGVVILATNRKDTLDGALTRRVSAVIDFPIPDAAARADIWRKLLPPRERLADDVDVDALGRAAVLSGGEIKNAVLYSVRLAAHRKLDRLDHRLLVEAAETIARSRWGEATRRPAGFNGDYPLHNTNPRYGCRKGRMRLFGR